MAFIVRIDTRETIGYFTGLKGPLLAGAQGGIFQAWRYPDGSLRHEPPSLPSVAAGSFHRPSPMKLSIPVHDPAAADLALGVADLSGFHHPSPGLFVVPAAALASKLLAVARGQDPPKPPLTDRRLALCQISQAPSPSATDFETFVPNMLL
jgi:hypothetical protein